MNNETSDGGATVPCISLLADDSQFRCTVCGQIGTVGRCCGLDTREPLNDLARAELVAEENRKANTLGQPRRERKHDGKREHNRTGQRRHAVG